MRGRTVGRRPKYWHLNGPNNEDLSSPSESVTYIFIPLSSKRHIVQSFEGNVSRQSQLESIFKAIEAIRNQIILLQFPHSDQQEQQQRQDQWRPQG